MSGGPVRPGNQVKLPLPRWEAYYVICASSGSQNKTRLQANTVQGFKFGRISLYSGDSDFYWTEDSPDEQKPNAYNWYRKVEINNLFLVGEPKLGKANLGFAPSADSILWQLEQTDCEPLVSCFTFRTEETSGPKRYLTGNTKSGDVYLASSPSRSGDVSAYWYLQPAEP